MNIEELYVKSFGKLSDVKIKLCDNFNVIYGQNESGKSTLIAFIRAMLYGLSEKKNKTPDRIAYMPWDGSEAGGDMVLTCAGKKLRIHRTFDRNNHRKDQCQISDMIKGVELNLDGEDITGLTLSAFDSTVFIRQLSVTRVADENKDLYNKLVNMAQTGQEDTDAGNALIYLEDRIKELSGRRKDVSINSVMERRNLLERELNELIKQHQLMMEDESRLLDLKERLKVLEDEIDQLDKIKPSLMMLDEWERDFSKLKLEIERLDGEIKELEKTSLNGYREELKQKQKKLDELLSQKRSYVDDQILKRYAGYSVYLTLGIVLAAAGLLAAFLNPLFFTFLAIGAIVAFVGYKGRNRYYQLIQMKQQAEDQEALAKQLILDIDSIKVLINETETRLGQLRFAKDEKKQRLQELKKRIDDLMDSLSAYNMVIEWRYSNTSKGYDLDSIMELSSQKIKEKEMIISQIASIDERWKDGEIFKRIPELRQEIDLLDRLIEKMNFEYKAFKLAYDVMRNCLEEVNTDFTPRLINRAGEIIKSITGRYDRVGIDSENLKLSVIVPEYSVFKSPFDLSGGTADQIYLGFRIALADAAASDKNPPLILDDALVQYDDERLKNTLRFLVEYSKKRQVILFTCHRREIDMLEDLCDGDINIIEL